MENQLFIILAAVAAVIAGTFILKAMLGNIFKIAGLLVVAFLSLRQDVGASGFDWVLPYQMVIILGAALFGWLVHIVANVAVFKEDGFGRHFFSPLIAVAATYLAAMLVEL